MSKEWFELLAALLIALPGILGLLLQLSNYREAANKTKKEAEKLGKESNKTDMEAADNLVDTALSLTTPLKEENQRLANRNKYLEKGNKILIKQLKEAGIEPAFDPTNGNGDSEHGQNGSMPSNTLSKRINKNDSK